MSAIEEVSKEYQYSKDRLFKQYGIDANEILFDEPVKQKYEPQLKMEKEEEVLN